MNCTMHNKAWGIGNFALRAKKVGGNLSNSILELIVCYVLFSTLNLRADTEKS